MMTFITNPWFWVSVILVSVASHFVMNRFFGGAGAGG